MHLTKHAVSITTDNGGDGTGTLRGVNGTVEYMLWPTSFATTADVTIVVATATEAVVYARTNIGGAAEVIPVGMLTETEAGSNGVGQKGWPIIATDGGYTITIAQGGASATGVINFYVNGSGNS